MANITINNNGTVNIYNVNDTSVSEEKDKLLTKLYWARHKSTMGGYSAWLELLDMYYANEWKQMYGYIKAFRGKGGKTRNECLKSLEIIMRG